MSTVQDLFSPPAEPAANQSAQAPPTTEQEPPSQPGPRTYGEDNVELPEELQDALLRLAQEAQRQDLYQRRIEVMRDRRNRFYERGIQHIYEDIRTGMFVQGTPGALVPDPNGDGMLQCGQFLNDYDIFGRSLQIIIAKLTENPVGVDFQPDSADSSADLQASEAAEAYRLVYDRRNDSKDLLTAIVRMMGLSGRVITWTRTEEDVQKWGRDETGAPRRVQCTNVYGTLESKVPVMAKTMSDWPYCIISEDPHLYMAKMEHPAFADEIESQGDAGVGDTQFERMARIGALQGNSASFQITDTYNFYVEKKYCWFRPAMFVDKELDSTYIDEQHLDQEDEDGKPIPWTLRDALNEAFPDGCCATFIGNQYVCSRNISMDDELAVDFPYAGDGMSRRAIMDPAVPIQDDFNDDMNNYHEVKVVGWPSTWVNQDVADLATINDQLAAPYAFRALKVQMPRDSEMEHQFYREPDPQIPASFMQHTEYMATQLLQFILAIPSAVQGAGMPDQKTASGYTAALSQALGQLGVIWGAVQRLVSVVYRQAALCAAKEPSEQRPIVIPGPKGQSVTVDLASLGKGRFLCHPDIDSGYPESTVQKRGTLAQIMELATANPLLAQAIFQSPDNWDFFARTMGIPEITLPEAKSRRKQVAEIEILLQQSPAAPSPEELEAAQQQHAEQTIMAHAAGGPPPQPFDPASLQHSSVPVEPLDFHDWEFEECREFLSDWPKVQQQINAGNQAGVQNVRLHAMEHQKFMAQEAAAAAQAQAAAQPQPKPAPAKGKETPAKPAEPNNPQPTLQ
jgi:hypothetical protein